ncbi:MAG: bifunctional hydroxymethylpyrimidine kinase/phosphomethylpyrimidine kinase [Sphingomonadaceae bacterium]|nr:bifunctional hydroxymethylpyrimidine kinase/phosphomethylpyrimidine kinase [Sphingomonadaceae bacterium]
MTIARILTIGSSDSGGGGGIEADIKTVTMFGGHAMAAVTAVTVQNTLAIDAVHSVPADVVVAQIDAIVRDIGVDAVKIGKIRSLETVSAIAERLETIGAPIVFDPVFMTASGAPFADADDVEVFERLMRVASLVTPNLSELEALGGRDAVLAHGCHLLIKGGQGEGDMITDQLWSPAGMIAELQGKIFDTVDAHGAGCTLATAVACRLGQGFDVAAAFRDGVRFVRLAILSAPGFGGGCGPLGHSAVRDFWDEDEPVPGIALNQVTVGAADYSASVEFYKTLGLRQIVNAPANGYARFEADNGATFSIHQGAERGGVVYLESPRLDGWVRDLVEQGVAFDQLPRDEDWLWREARLRDPAGNVICLYRAGENRRYPPWRIA